MAKENRAKYPPGTRIMLLSMDDPHHPVPPGTRGTVEHVDDAGTIHMKWDQKKCSQQAAFFVYTAFLLRIPARGAAFICRVGDVPLISRRKYGIMKL